MRKPILLAALVLLVMISMGQEAGNLASQNNEVCQNYEVVSNSTSHPTVPNQRTANLQFNYPVNTSITNQAGIETDGSFFYVTVWNSSAILKYSMTGNYISQFSIPGVSGLRDLAYDGTYFYGGNAGSAIYEMDFTTGTLAGVINCPAGTEVRNICYNGNDAFWVGNWATDLSLISRTGLLLNSISAQSHGCTGMYGSAYDSISIGGPYVWIIEANTSQNAVDLKKINIASGNQTFQYNILPDVGSGTLGGGLFIEPNILAGTVTLGGLVQETAIFGYDLNSFVDSIDVGITNILTPISGTSLTNSEQISVNIQNFGSQSISSGFNVAYSVSGANPIVESYTGTLGVGQSVVFTFNQTADFSTPGIYELIVATSLSGDQNANNDTITTTLVTLSNIIPKLPLVEEFNAAGSCSPCCSLEPFYQTNIIQSGNSCATIRYGCPWTGYTDPYHTTEDSVRYAYYGVNAVPNVSFNGGAPEHLSIITTSLITNSYNTEYSVFFMDVSAQILGNQVVTEVDVIPQININTPTAVLQVVIVENETYNNVTCTEVNQVLYTIKKMLPNELGTPLGSLMAGNVYTFPFSYTFPVGNTVEDFSNLSIVAFIQNNANHAVHQSARTIVDTAITLSASFEVDTTAGLVGSSFNFTDLTTGTANSWLWDFGDGTTSTLQNPSHTYLSEGLYTVSLIASNYFDSDTVVYTDYIELAYTQSWNYNITGTNHTILVPATATITIDGNPIQNGDYIGVFYGLPGGGLACGGYMEWTGNLNSITAWGVDIGGDGFASNEVFKWKIWQSSTNVEYDATAVYNINSMFPNDSVFIVNGLSGIVSLSAFSLKDIGIESIISPVSDCNLSNSEALTVSIKNFEQTDLNDTFTIKYSLDNGLTWISEIFNGPAIPGNDIVNYTFSSYLNLQSPNTYQLLVKTELFADIDASNDAQSTTIENLTSPTAYAGLGNEICGTTYELDASLIGQQYTNAYWSTSFLGADFDNEFDPAATITIPDSWSEPGEPLAGSFGDSAFVTAAVIWNIYAYTCHSSDTLEITFYQTPTSNAGQDDVICSLNYDFAAEFTTGNSTGEWSMIDGTGTANWLNGNNTAPNASVTVSEYGLKAFQWIEYNSGKPSCSDKDTVYIEFVHFDFEAQTEDLSLIGANDGTIEISVIGGTPPYIYIWSNGETTEDLYSLAIGIYDLTISDNNACNLTGTFEISNPAPNWSYTISSSNHTILIQNITPITIDGVQIDYGDYIGVFYDSLGTLACGGYQVWENTTTSIAAWAAETGLNNGFVTGEQLKWKIWDASDDLVYDAVADYMPMPPMLNQGIFAVNGLSGLLSLTSVVLSESQEIALLPGWSFFSTYIVSDEPSLDSIFTDIVTNVEIVKNYLGQAYWPAWGINMIGNISNCEGYQIKTSLADTLIITGLSVEPENTTCNILAGWSYISYLRKTPASIVVMLSAIASDVVIVKNYLGQTYWPVYGINMIGNMVPGEAYQIKMYNAVILTYPANEVNVSK